MKFLTVLFALLAVSAESAQLAPTNAPASVTLIWDLYPSTNSTVIGFNLYMGPASYSYTNVLFVPGITSTNVTVTNIVRAGTYFFNITAFDGTLESPFDGEVSYTVPMVPAAVTRLRVK